MRTQLTQELAEQILDHPKPVIDELASQGFDEKEITGYLRYCRDVAAGPPPSPSETYDQLPDHLRDFNSGTDFTNDRLGRVRAGVSLMIGILSVGAAAFWPVRTAPVRTPLGMFGVFWSWVGYGQELKYKRWRRYADAREISRETLADMIQQATLEELMGPPPLPTGMPQPLQQELPHSGAMVDPQPLQQGLPHSGAMVDYSEGDIEELDQILGGGSTAIVPTQIVGDYPNLKEVLSVGHKLITGGESSGKATTAITMLSEVFDTGYGVIPFCYDPSEGGEMDSRGRVRDSTSWMMGGIPSTSDVWEFADFLDCLYSNLDKRKFRNDPGYDQQPPIVVMIDEIITSLEPIAFEDKKRYKEICYQIQTLATRGTKVGVFIILTGQSVQIQNLKSILNTGIISNLEVIALNAQITQRVDDLKINRADLPADYHRYMKDKQGKFKAAVFKETDGVITPVLINHPTHDGATPAPRVAPTRPIPKPNLAPLPHWVSGPMRTHYEFFSKLQTGEVEIEGDGSQVRSNLEPGPEFSEQEAKLIQATASDLARGLTKDHILATWINSGRMTKEDATHIWRVLNLDDYT